MDLWVIFLPEIFTTHFFFNSFISKCELVAYSAFARVSVQFLIGHVCDVVWFLGTMPHSERPQWLTWWFAWVFADLHQRIEVCGDFHWWGCVDISSWSFVQPSRLWGCWWVVLTEGMEVEGFLPYNNVNTVGATCGEPIAAKSALNVLREITSQCHRCRWCFWFY